MKQKLIVAGLIGCLIMAGCRSRFTSTSDASGPRKHQYANPSFEHSGNTGRSAEMPIETIDSGRGNQMNTRTDSLNAVKATTDTTRGNVH